MLLHSTTPADSLARLTSKKNYSSSENVQILDVGCGLCDNAIFLAAQGEDVTAIDFSPDALRQAEKRIAAAKLGSTSGLKTRVADALNLTAVFGDETFDTVLDSAMLHCFNPADQRKYVESLTPHVSCPPPVRMSRHSPWRRGFLL